MIVSDVGYETLFGRRWEGVPRERRWRAVYLSVAVASRATPLQMRLALVELFSHCSPSLPIRLCVIQQYDMVLDDMALSYQVWQ